MELDINPSWVSFNTYQPALDGTVHGTKVYGLHADDRYLSPDSRDFIAMLVRGVVASGATGRIGTAALHATIPAPGPEAPHAAYPVRRSAGGHGYPALLSMSPLTTSVEPLEGNKVRLARRGAGRRLRAGDRRRVPQARPRGPHPRVPAGQGPPRPARGTARHRGRPGAGAPGRPPRVLRPSGRGRGHRRHRGARDRHHRGRGQRRRGLRRGRRGPPRSPRRRLRRPAHRDPQPGGHRRGGRRPDRRAARPLRRPRGQDRAARRRRLRPDRHQGLHPRRGHRRAERHRLSLRGRLGRSRAPPRRGAAAASGSATSCGSTTRSRSASATGRARRSPSRCS